MRHQRLRGKLGVKTKHRRALMRNLVKHLVIRKRIKTTLAKAKAASSFADRMIQIAKRGDLNARRLLISKLGCSDTAHNLIVSIAPHFKDRQGGYTRVLRLGTRPGDGGQVALLEFTTEILAPEKPKKAKKEKKQKEHTHAHEAAEAPKKEKAKPKAPHHEAAGEKKPSKKEDKDLKHEEKKESEKKGGFLGALRRFLKGDEEK